MIPHLDIATPTLPRFNLGEHDIVTIDGREYSRATDIETAEILEAGYVLRALDDAKCVKSFSHEEFALRTQHSRFALQRGALDPVALRYALEEKFKGQLKDTLAELDDAERSQIQRRFFYCMNFIEDINKGFIAKTMEGAEKSIEKSYLVLSKKNEAHQSKLPSPPSARTLFRWISKLEKFQRTITPDQHWTLAYNPLVLRRSYTRSGNRDPRFSKAAREILLECSKDYLTLDRKTVKYVQEQMQIRYLDLKLQEELPSVSTILRFLRRHYGEAAIHAFRYGEASARKKYAPRGAGQAQYRPLELVLIDDWQAHLMTFLSNKAFHAMPPTVQEKIAAGRLNVCYAVDAATGMPLALQISDAPSTSRALRVMHLCHLAKSELYRALGATSSHEYIGHVGSFCMDNGPNFATPEVETAALDLGSTMIHTPAGVSNLRGAIEQAFRTLDVQLIQQFSGRTFSNPVDLGDYNPSKRTQITDEEFLQALAIYVSDIIANSASSTKFLESRHDTWVRLTDQFGVEIPPDKTTLRHVFGLEVKRTLSARGVTFMGIRYHSKELAYAYQSVAEVKVTLRVSEFDMGTISVLLPSGSWIDVPSILPHLDNVYLKSWIDSVAAVKASNKAANRLNLELVLAAGEKLRLMGPAHRARIALLTDQPKPEEIDRIEARHFTGFYIPDETATTLSTFDTDLSAIGLMPTRRQQSPAKKLGNKPPNEDFQLQDPDDDDTWMNFENVEDDDE